MADYELYIDDFKAKGFLITEEPTFYIIRTLLRQLSLTYIWGFVIYALFSVSIRYKSITSFSNSILGSILIWISYVLVVQDMIAIRSAVASSLLPFILYARSENKTKSLIILIVIAVLFHYSALLYLLFLFMSPSKPRRWLYITLIFVCYVLSLSGLTLGKLITMVAGGSDVLLLARLTNYESEELNIFNLLQIGHLLLCFFGWFTIGKIKQNNPIALLLLKSFTLSVCLLPLFSDVISMGIRISELFLVAEVLLVPLISFSVFKSTFIQKCFVFAYSFLVFYFTISNLQYWNFDLYY